MIVGYIVGTVIGSIFMIAGLGFYLFLYLRINRKKRLIRNIGRTAEQKINDDLKLWSKYTKNKFIDSNVYKYNERYFFETDSVLVTSKGLIVVEIKSIKGGIEGKANDLKWIKVNNGQRSYVTNSIIQNDKHINHIINLLSEKVPIISLIVYSNRTQYINIDNLPSHVVITRHSNLFDVLDELNNSLKNALSEEQMRKIYRNLSSFTTKNENDLLQFKKIYSKGAQA